MTLSGLMVLLSKVDEELWRFEINYERRDEIKEKFKCEMIREKARRKLSKARLHDLHLIEFLKSSYSVFLAKDFSSA